MPDFDRRSSIPDEPARRAGLDGVRFRSWQMVPFLIFGLIEANCLTLYVHDYPPEERSKKVLRANTNTFQREREETRASVKLENDVLVVNVDQSLLSEQVAVDQVEVAYHQRRSAFDDKGLWTRHFWFGYPGAEDFVEHRSDHRANIYQLYLISVVFTLGIDLVWAVGDWLSLPFRSFDHDFSATEHRERIITSRKVAEGKRPVTLFVNREPRTILPGGASIPLSDLWREGSFSENLNEGRLQIRIIDERTKWEQEFDLDGTSFFQHDIATVQSILSGASDGQGDQRMITFNAAVFEGAPEEERVLTEFGKAYGGDRVGVWERTHTNQRLTNIDLIETGPQMMPMGDPLLDCKQCWVPTGRYVLRFSIAGWYATTKSFVRVRLFTNDVQFVVPLAIRNWTARAQTRIRGRLIRRSLDTIDLEM